MASRYYNPGKLSKLLGKNISKSALFDAEEKGNIPSGERYRSGAIQLKGWSIEDVPIIGEKFGFLKQMKAPISMAVFTTKGGVLKTTLTMNVARMAALHNIKTCVVGLDMQGDITNALGHNSELEEIEDLGLVMEKINQTRGLADVFNRSSNLRDIICDTDIPTLKYVPETPELAALNESLVNVNRREYWLQEKIIMPLKEEFDLILMDCSPNWNRLITNALVACDILLSPLECKINNFRNLRVFRYFLDEFKKDMNLFFETFFIPTRYSPAKKLSMDIREWYQKNVDGSLSNGMRECVLGEEALALRMSLCEHAPGKVFAKEMQELLKEIFTGTEKHLEKKKERQMRSPNFGVDYRSEENQLY